ncbi:MAG TPA: autotransporter outer membrane beta-barrel domain-containing protein [Steroidobacteraceae bacterium]|nr:autotransporter outer membrane beta-barrel domain-containing protein [Steroidobacteraceae bacterium]
MSAYPASPPRGRARARARALVILPGAMLFGLIGLLGRSAPSGAQNASSGSLLRMVNTLSSEGVYQFDALGRQAAIANDAAFASLQPLCGTTSPAAAAPSPSCSGATLKLYDRLRELEDNANELLRNSGETQFSLHLDPSGMANALQWTAPEEFAAQGSMATRFANSQAALLSNRFAALRFASQGIRIADAGLGQPSGYPDALGGAAGADSDAASFGRWSAYVNGGYGSGSKDPTVFEDAFYFDDTQVSAGADVRLSNHLVMGLMAGHVEKRVDFNSAESIVDGSIRGNGQSVLLYAQLEWSAAYLDLAVGVQHMTLDSRRDITYPSNNPLIPSVNETSYSNTGATSWIGTLGTGYTFQYRGFSANPYLNVQSVSTRISSFTEHNGNGFDIDTPSQSIQSLEADPGLKLEYTLLGGFGVLIPYAYGEYRREFRDNSRDISSSYSAGTGGVDFNLPTDAAPRHYFVAGGGASAVLKHGVQAFVQYLQILDYQNYSDHVISGGIRLEF